MQKKLHIKSKWRTRPKLSPKKPGSRRIRSEKRKIRKLNRKRLNKRKLSKI